jgi:KRAB domain-containing zinc finger protein
MRQKIENSSADMAKSATTRSSMPLTYTKNEEGLFVCPHCDYKKSNQSTMHYHMKKHEEQLSHICKTCKKGFLQKQTLDLHIRSKHPEVKPVDAKKFTCPFDGCTFTSLTKGNCIIHCLRIHFQEEIRNMMEIHDDTKTIECKECKNEFQSSSSFYYHAKQCLPFDKTSTKYTKLQQCMC